MHMNDMLKLPHPICCLHRFLSDDQDDVKLWQFPRAESKDKQTWHAFTHLKINCYVKKSR